MEINACIGKNEQKWVYLAKLMIMYHAFQFFLACSNYNVSVFCYVACAARVWTKFSPLHPTIFVCLTLQEK